MYRCPRCASFGIYPIKRRWWQRLFNLSHRYYCYDCGQDCAHPHVVEAEHEKLTSQGGRTLDDDPEGEPEKTSSAM